MALWEILLVGSGNIWKWGNVENSKMPLSGKVSLLKPDKAVKRCMLHPGTNVHRWHGKRSGLKIGRGFAKTKHAKINHAPRTCGCEHINFYGDWCYSAARTTTSEKRQAFIFQSLPHCGFILVAHASLSSSIARLTKAVNHVAVLSVGFLWCSFLPFIISHFISSYILAWLILFCWLLLPNFRVVPQSHCCCII